MAKQFKLTKVDNIPPPLDPSVRKSLRAKYERKLKNMFAEFGLLRTKKDYYVKAYDHLALWANTHYSKERSYSDKIVVRVHIAIRVLNDETNYLVLDGQNIERDSSLAFNEEDGVYPKFSFKDDTSLDSCFSGMMKLLKPIIENYLAQNESDDMSFLAEDKLSNLNEHRQGRPIQSRIEKSKQLLKITS